MAHGMYDLYVRDGLEAATHVPLLSRRLAGHSMSRIMGLTFYRNPDSMDEYV